MLAGILLTAGVLSFSGWPESPLASQPDPLPLAGGPAGGSPPTPAPAAVADIPPAAAAPAVVLPGSAGPPGPGDDDPRPTGPSPRDPVTATAPVAGTAPVVVAADRSDAGIPDSDAPLARQLTASTADALDGVSDTAGGAVSGVHRGAGETTRRTGRQVARVVRGSGQTLTAGSRELAPALPEIGLPGPS